MLPWTRAERRWRDALFAAMIPPAADDAHPGLAALELATFWRTLHRSAPPLLRFGLRASVLLLTWLPVLRFGRPFHRLAPAAQDRVLRWAGASRSYLVRQLVTTIKLLACFAYLQDHQVRARLDPMARP